MKEKYLYYKIRSDVKGEKIIINKTIYSWDSIPNEL